MTEIWGRWERCWIGVEWTFSVYPPSRYTAKSSHASLPHTHTASAIKSACLSPGLEDLLWGSCRKASSKAQLASSPSQLRLPAKVLITVNCDGGRGNWEQRRDFESWKYSWCSSFLFSWNFFLQEMVYLGSGWAYIYCLFKDCSGFKTALICTSRYKAIEPHPLFWLLKIRSLFA